MKPNSLLYQILSQLKFNTDCFDSNVSDVNSLLSIFVQLLLRKLLHNKYNHNKFDWKKCNNNCILSTTANIQSLKSNKL